MKACVSESDGCRRLAGGKDINDHVRGFRIVGVLE